ncbi:helix-turn-helix transcriptional regulator [Mammaliicoccus stepanovicii]|uniref:helix-turn-helix transcriptional regulator n=1 Tax=Mammaliicoccus stepanovicii TaxID=643214 RepID=UPI000BA48182|nr:helix-turn-helix transcriptional regulator [Mammaliicoccus stepanovicii]PNZ72772.1 transcriptional repressor CcpN [Mammaliicoccus stepanovicii]
MRAIELNQRQEQIVQIVKSNGPITGEKIADRLNLTRATLRPDLAILTMAGYLDARPRVGYFYTGKSSTQLLSDSIKKMTIKESMAIPVVVEEDASVYEAICKMFLEDVGTLFVINKEGYLTGVCSRKDLLRAAIGGQSLKDTPVSINMSRMPNITVCLEEDLLIYAAKLLIDKQIDALPVVKKLKNNKMKVKGRITKTTITRAFVSLIEDE